jgi:hypothetical protein
MRRLRLDEYENLDHPLTESKRARELTKCNSSHGHNLSPASNGYREKHKTFWSPEDFPVQEFPSKILLDIVDLVNCIVPADIASYRSHQDHANHHTKESDNNYGAI